MHDYGNPQIAGSVTLANPLAAPKVDRQSIIKEYEWAITELDSVIGELFDRLAPVLAPYYADSGALDSMPEVSEPEVSDARARLMHLHSLTASLRGALERLEV